MNKILSLYHLAIATKDTGWLKEPGIHVLALDDQADKPDLLIYARLYMTMAFDQKQAYEKVKLLLDKAQVKPLTLFNIAHFPVPDFTSPSESPSIRDANQRAMEIIIKEPPKSTPDLVSVTNNEEGKKLLIQHFKEFGQAINSSMLSEIRRH